MRTYEALYIVQPEASDDEVQTVVSEVEKLITDDGGTIVRSEIWGKRRLAYQIKKIKEGFYILLRFQCNPTLIDPLESHFRLSEDIFRSMVVHFDDKTLRLEEEQARRNQALLESRSGMGDRRPEPEDKDRPSVRPRERQDREPESKPAEPAVAATSSDEATDA